MEKSNVGIFAMFGAGVILADVGMARSATLVQRRCEAILLRSLTNGLGEI